MEDAVVESAATAEFLASSAPSTRLLDQRRRAMLVGDQMERFREHFEAQELHLRTREEALFRKDLELQDALLKVNPLLDDNQVRKVRAEKLLAEEERGRVAKEEELVVAHGQLEEAHRTLEGLAESRRKLAQYYSYMVAFQAAYPDEFPDQQSIMLRNNTLNGANQDLMAESERLEGLLDEARTRLSKAQKARATHALTSENTLVRLKERLEGARAEVARLSNAAEEGLASASKRALQFGQLLRSVANLHRRCMASQGGKAVHHTTGDAEVLGWGVSGLFTEALAKALAAGGGVGVGGLPKDAFAALTAAAEAATAAAAAELASSSTSTANNSSSAAEGGEGGEAHQAVARKTLARAPVFIARAPESYFAATRALAASSLLGRTAAAEGGGGGGAGAMPAPPASSLTEEEGSGGGGEGEGVVDTGMAPDTVVGHMRTALGLLGSVGSYIVDFDDVVEGYGGFVAKGQAAAAEKKRVAAAEASARGGANTEKLKQEFRASKAASAAATAAAGGGGKEAASGPHVGVNSRPPTSPIALMGSSSKTPSANVTPGSSHASSSVLFPTTTGMGLGSTRVGTAQIKGTFASSTVGGGLGAGGGAGGGVGGAVSGVTAEALAAKRNYERAGVKAYFTLKSPLPPPEEVMGVGGKLASGSGLMGVRGAAGKSGLLGVSGLSSGKNLKGGGAGGAVAGSMAGSLAGSVESSGKF